MYRKEKGDKSRQKLREFIHLFGKASCKVFRGTVQVILWPQSSGASERLQIFTVSGAQLSCFQKCLLEIGQLQALKCNDLSNQSDILAIERSGDQILDAGTSF